MLSEELNYIDLLPSADRQTVLSTLTNLRDAACGAVSSVSSDKVAVAFSGGIDSSIVSKLMPETDTSLELIALGREGSADLQVVSNIRTAFHLSSRIHAETITVSEIEQAATETAKIVYVSNLAHFEDCLSFWLIAKKAKQIKGITTLLSANGADELFCGYDRFRRILDASGYEAIKKEISASLHTANFLGKEAKKIVSDQGLDLVEPLFSQNFIHYALTIPVELKILPANDMLRKRIWRLLGRQLRLREQIVQRPKKAMQYGMGVHAIILSMLRKDKLRLDLS